MKLLHVPRSNQQQSILYMPGKHMHLEHMCTPHIYITSCTDFKGTQNTLETQYHGLHPEAAAPVQHLVHAASLLHTCTCTHMHGADHRTPLVPMFLTLEAPLAPRLTIYLLVQLALCWPLHTPCTHCRCWHCGHIFLPLMIFCCWLSDSYTGTWIKNRDPHLWKNSFIRWHRQC